MLREVMFEGPGPEKEDTGILRTKLGKRTILKLISYFLFKQ